jgi:hypothetical protein
MWECAIEGCGHRTEAPEELLVHQATDHRAVRCEVCGTRVPDGYFAIRHVFGEHSRAQYVRAYDADPEEIKHRQAVREAVEGTVDLDAVVEALNSEEA